MWFVISVYCECLPRAVHSLPSRLECRQENLGLHETKVLFGHRADRRDEQSLAQHNGLIEAWGCPLVGLEKGGLILQQNSAGIDLQQKRETTGLAPIFRSIVGPDFRW
jgi:hypothetical protein